MRRTIIAISLLLFTISVAMAQQTAHSNINVAILGDSNTWIGGDDCDKGKGWNKWFKDIFRPASCKSYARSGATWTNTPQTKTNTEENIAVLGDDNVIYNQIVRLQEAVKKGLQPMPNLIIIAAGTNDAWFEDKRTLAFSQNADEVFSMDEKPITDRPVNTITSLAASVRYGCEMLMESFPNAQIILLTPLQCTAITLSQILRTGDIIEDCARHMSICVIRQDKTCCVSRTRELRTKRFTTDGTHTNAEGARRNGIFLAKKIASMLQTE